MRWALQAGGKPVAEAVTAAFARALESKPAEAARALSTADLEPYGRLSAEHECALRCAALSAVIAPMSRVLLGQQHAEGSFAPSMEGFAGATKAALVLAAAGDE